MVRTAAPWGVDLEIVLGLADARAPFSSPLVPSGFLTDGVGFGHAVFATTAFDESDRFLTDGLGFVQSDWLEMELGPGLSLEVRFYHCNERHHTLALARSPFDLPQRLHHVMFEANDTRRCRHRVRPSVDDRLPIPNGLGRHDNDGMFSFYMQTPAGFQIEFGHGARVITERLGRQPTLRPHQRLGPPAAAPVVSAAPDAPVRAQGTRRGRDDRRRRSRRPRTGTALAQRGRSVVILEQWPRAYSLPRAVHFDHEVGRILQSCGVGDQVRAVSEPAEIYEWRNAEGTTLLRFGRIGTARSGWPFSSMFCQPEVEAQLEFRAGSLPSLDIRRGVRVNGLDQHDDHVVVDHASVEIGADGQLLARSASTVRTSYVVGCDGANSTVRDLLGVTMDDRGFFYDWLIVDVILDEPRVFDPINLQICDPRRPTTAVSGGPGRRRWEFMRLPDERLEDLNARSPPPGSYFAPWDVHPANARLERHAVYTFAARVADAWQVGRTFLAGDAAHQMPPFAGQGMCAGLRDAANLAWKLDLVLTGRAGTGLLATYDEERRPSAIAAIEFSIELGKVICVPDPTEAKARDDAMAAAVTDEISEVPDLPGIASGLVHAESKRAGELFPQGDLGGRWFDDVHGAGWRFVTVDPDAADFDASLVDWLDSIGGTVVDVRGTAPDLEAWFVANDALWALQRPDFHVYGTAVDVVGAAQLVEDLRRRLAPPLLRATR